MATYVLIHGAYQGGWIWKPVAQRLQKAGHLVYAPTLDGCGERQEQIRPRHYGPAPHRRALEGLLRRDGVSVQRPDMTRDASSDWC